MTERTNVEDIIADECIYAIQRGVTNWVQIRDMINKRIASLPNEDRLDAEYRLSLMIDRDQHRPHQIVRH